MESNLSIGLLYIGLHSELKKKFGANMTISKRDIFEKIGRFNHLSKSLRPIVIKEMEEKGLLQKIDRENYKILPNDIDLEQDVNKLYKLAGLFLSTVFSVLIIK